MRVSMLNRGPLVRSNCDTALKNVTNLRGEVDPQEDRSTRNSQSAGHMNYVVPQYQLFRSQCYPLLVIVCFF